MNGLYAKMDLLPDVLVAKEARESDTPGGLAIFKMIMVSRCCYAIMDDYDLPINLDSENPGAPAFPNGDTTVRWKLQDRMKLCQWTYGFIKGRRMRTWKWNIKESDYINEKESS